MDTLSLQKTPDTPPLGHALGPHFRELAQFHSTKALEASALYASLRPEVERVLNGVEQANFTPEEAPPPLSSGAVRATAWNIERGIKLDEIIRVLHSQESMGRSDVLLLTELDYGMARSGNRHVAREIA